MIKQFLLVHGAGHGSWCWEKLIPLLRKAGYEVTAPTFSGLGEERELLSPRLDLSTHVRDVVKAVEERDLHDVVLVGHSYAGMVITGAAEVIPERIARLIYLDASCPLNGQSVVEMIPSFSRLVRMVETQRGKVPVVFSPPPEAFGISESRDIARTKRLLTPMPYRALTERIRVGNAAVRIPVSYILCAVPHSPASEVAHLAAFRRLKSAGGDCRKIDGPHDVMITDPEKLAAMLLDCASLNWYPAEADKVSYPLA